MHFITKTQQKSYGAVFTFGELHWSSHEKAVSATSVCFCLHWLSFAILSSPRVTYSTFCSSQDRITLKYCWCPAEKDAAGGGVLRGCVCFKYVCVCVSMCVTAVMQNNKADGIRFFVLLCCLVDSPPCFLFVFPSFFLSLSLESDFCLQHTMKWSYMFLKNLDEWYHRTYDVHK